MMPIDEQLPQDENGKFLNTIPEVNIRSSSNATKKNLFNGCWGDGPGLMFIIFYFYNNYYFANIFSRLTFTENFNSFYKENTII